MSDTKIEWTHVPGHKGRVWNPVTGCQKISQGCKNCYAERWHHRFGGGVPFTSARTHPERLALPGKTRNPSVFFVNSMSDLFWEKVPDEFIARVFDAMMSAPQHKYVVLTKRAERMHEFVNDYIGTEILPVNIAVGVSVEDSDTAIDRLEYLRHVRAHTRIVSVEPLLGDLDLAPALPWLSWVIVGGESGPGARPMPPATAHTIGRDCAKAGVPFFFKQWGEWGDLRTLSEGLEGKKAKTTGDTVMVRVGKRRAGDLLGGKERKQFPAAWLK